jgi:hypothetical protein
MDDTFPSPKLLIDEDVIILTGNLALVVRQY